MTKYSPRFSVEDNGRCTLLMIRDCDIPLVQKAGLLPAELHRLDLMDVKARSFKPFAPRIVAFESFAAARAIAYSSHSKMRTGLPHAASLPATRFSL